MLGTLRKAEYVLYKAPYLSQVQQEKDKKETNGWGRRYLPYLKVGKRDEFYSYIWFIRRGKEVPDTIGRLNSTLQKKRKKIKTTYDS